MTKVVCPGHITGFFEICKSEDARYTGSRGAGVCISKGVETKLLIMGRDGSKIDIMINGKSIPAPVTRSVIDQFLRLLGHSVSLRIEHEVQVPISAGFGASGAGALSTAVALNKELKLNMSGNSVATIAHIAEVENSTGLGDVIAQIHGGIEIRTEPGAPGIGRIDQIIPDPTVQLICMSLGKLETRGILTNPTHQERINQAGKILTKELLQDATIATFMRLSKKFSEESGLLSEKLKDLMVYVEDLVSLPTSMVMLGESLFAFIKRTECDEVCEKIQEYSPKLNIFPCEIDFRGPRIVEEQ